MKEAETVELHGGPEHGTELSIPLQFSKPIDIEAVFQKKEGFVVRVGRYTRVHDVSGRQTNFFEWSGYIEKHEIAIDDE